MALQGVQGSHPLVCAVRRLYRWTQLLQTSVEGLLPSDWCTNAFDIEHSSFGTGNLCREVTGSRARLIAGPIFDTMRKLIYYQGFRCSSLLFGKVRLQSLATNIYSRRKSRALQLRQETWPPNIVICHSHPSHVRALAIRSVIRY